MELDERKKAILYAVVKNYLETGEPVGSRTISKYTDLNLSSATIRNEMADLEEMGYIFQPHTSAGRIPSDKGYRLYVDTMMEAKVQEIDEMKEVLKEKADKMESLLEQVAKILANNTKYTSLVTGPKYRSKKVKFIQLTDVDENQIICVMLIEGNVVKNKVINTKESITKENLVKLNLILNSFLQGRDLEEITLEIISQIKAQAEGLGDVVNEILDVVARAINEEERVQIYTSGATNILRYPELGDRQRTTELLYAIEDKGEIEKLVQNDGEDKGIHIQIGDEMPLDAMRDCSVITTTYEIEDGVYGKIGIVGPKRMDYDKVAGTLHSLRTQLDEIFKKNKDK
ncbi:MAG: heat-inducible transcriptional repressor HrcA [Lachnospiraceae bacterium]|nr:heat-inducible transcriptional repressor HrcA [Lachnospiraceae bacterium]